MSGQGTREAASLVDRVVMRRAGGVSCWRISVRTCWPRPRCGRAGQNGSPCAAAACFGKQRRSRSSVAVLKRPVRSARWSQHFSRLDVLMTTPRPSPGGKVRSRIGEDSRPFEQPPSSSISTSEMGCRRDRRRSWARRLDKVRKMLAAARRVGLHYKLATPLQTVRTAAARLSAGTVARANATLRDRQPGAGADESVARSGRVQRHKLDKTALVPTASGRWGGGYASC